MKNTTMYSGYRYPAQVISHAVWLYHRFALSFRDVEELLAARGITVSYETVRNYQVFRDRAFAEWNRVSCVQNLG